MTLRAARLLAALAAVLLLAGCGDEDASGDSTSGAPRPEAPAISAAPAGYNAADVAFATAMVANHKQAIELATMATERSTNPALVAVADRILRTAQPEINILNVFLVQWNENPDAERGTDAPQATGPESAGQGRVDDATMARLGSLSGPEFDTLWLEQSIDHRRAGLQAADTEVADGENVDAISMAETIGAELTAQIEQMTTILEGRP